MVLAKVKNKLTIDIECPECNGLHSKCMAILNGLMEKWENERRDKVLIGIKGCS